MEKKIVLSCGDGHFNLGDEAIMASILENIRKEIKDTEVTVFSSDPNRTERIHNVKSKWMEMSFWGVIKGVIGGIKTFSKIDLLIWGGGNYISDDSSLLFTPFHLIKIVLAKSMRKKVIVYGIGVNSLNTSFVKFLTRIVVNHADIVTVRDEESKKILEDIGIKKPQIYVTADPAIILRPEKKAKIRGILEQDNIIKKKNQSLVAIVPRRVFHRKSKFLFSSIIPVKYKVKFGLIDKKSKIKFERFKETLARAADYLVEKLNARIIFIPMQMEARQKQEDNKVSVEIISKMKHKGNACILKTEKYTLQEVKGVYNIMDFIIGVRFHALVFACSTNVPIVSLPYSPKGRRLTKYLGIKKYSIPVEKVEYNNLIEKIELVLSNKELMKKNFKEKSKILKEKAKFNVKLALDMLK